MMCWISVLGLLVTIAAEGPKAPVEYVIRGAVVLDGTGSPGRAADIAIRGDRIVSVGDVKPGASARIIDGHGLLVAPGFIDLHTHCDTGSPTITSSEGRAGLCYLMQGVTSVVTGNCGSGPLDVAAYYATLDKNRIGPNVLHQVPHNAVRQKVMGNANRPPTDAELKAMEDLVDRGMKDGAWSLSTGLYYNPGTYAQTSELVALSRVAARHGGFYASHMRDEGTGLLASIQEVLTIAREAKIPVHISHLKAFGPRTWGKAGEAIALITDARAHGLRVTADQYPYRASSTSIAAELIPPQFREGRPEDLLHRLDDSEQGPRLRQAIGDRLTSLKGGESIWIARYEPRPDWQGLVLQSIADREKESVLDVVLDITRHGGAQIVNFSMQEEDVRLIMRQPFVATASDGSVQLPGNSVPHPRSYGCFPRKIGRYAIEDGIITLPAAVRSASGLPADILGLPERGYVKAGYIADLIVLDPGSYRDRATFEKPHQLATGVKHLFVNGVMTIEDGKYTDALAGRALRHESRPR